MRNVQLEHSHDKPGVKKFPICFLAHDIEVPMNIGSLFRIADAFGVQQIYLTGGSCTPPNNKIRKTSRCTEKYVEYSYERDPLEVVKRLRSEGYKVISLEITTLSVDIRDVKLSSDDRICLIVGAEDEGVCQDLLDVSDQTVHIPMLGRNSSMNLATACSIATFEIVRRFLP